MSEHTGPGYASPQVAREQPPEQVVYVAALYEGTGIDKPDFIAVVDVDPSSDSYGEIVGRTDMPNVGDELHHFGFNACSSACHSQLSRDTLVVPGFRSSRIHMLDISDPRTPTIKHVIEGDEIKEKLGLSAPHTVHCMPGDIITISMLGDAEGNAPGGFAILDARDFSIAGRWESEQPADLEFMYDFWYQPRQNTLVSSEWGAPNTFQPGFDPADVAAGKYGRKLHFWDLEQRGQVQTVDLGDDGWIPLELRWQHNPDSNQGFVGVTLSSVIKRFFRTTAPGRPRRSSTWLTSRWRAGRSGRGAGPDHRPGALARRQGPVLLQLAARRPAPLRRLGARATRSCSSQVWLGGLLGRDGGHPKASEPLNGGPQMLQDSLDGKRVYVSNSLYSTWDNQFYPGIEGVADDAASARTTARTRSTRTSSSTSRADRGCPTA